MRLIFMLIFMFVTTVNGNNSYTELVQEYYSIINKLKSIGGEDARLTLKTFSLQNDFYEIKLSFSRTYLLTCAMEQDILNYERLSKKENKFKIQEYNQEITELIEKMDNILEEYKNIDLGINNIIPSFLIKKFSREIAVLQISLLSPFIKGESISTYKRYIEAESKLNSKNKYKKQYAIKREARNLKIDKKLLTFARVRLNRTKDFEIVFKNTFNLNHK